MCAFARTLSAPPGGVRPLVSGEAILLNDADDRLALPGGGGVRSEPSPGGVRELLLLGGVVLKVAEDGVATLGVCRFSKALKPPMVTMGERVGVPLKKVGNWKCVCALVRPEPSRCGLRVAMGLIELQKCTGMSGVCGSGDGSRNWLACSALSALCRVALLGRLAVLSGV